MVGAGKLRSCPPLASAETLFRFVPFRKTGPSSRLGGGGVINMLPRSYISIQVTDNMFNNLTCTQFKRPKCPQNRLYKAK